MSQQQFKYSNSVILYPLLFVMVIWSVFWYQVRVDSSIRKLGVHPQELEGLLGIVTSPFIHADIEHLYHNTIPLFILTMALFYFYNKIAWRVLLYGVLLSGLLTWLIGKSGNHIGASGVIYVLVSFIFFKGILAKHYRLIALSLMVIFLYGSMIWYVFPIKDGVSWEGHLGGLISGLLFAIIFRKQIAKPKRYVWETETYNEEDDPFMKHFDKNGNFIEVLPEEEIETTTEADNKLQQPSITIKYTYKKKGD
ncbi:rhomboid family intramembrane serine protease [Winogradskyella immobilis]|uniref:Rhomboid family intramembrane serine protease n=1 Tax=Winogradskyella immobilis TaxID=2816852 RepID=A0ABS8ENM2_9FLAO|nr:rhomboid family intramembrane serine protease [Winogradskyella immobilis]MCC1484710.1 rhomboid family intramembrane serine protease [Winogradskyella immobilis]MCG0016802.1 rhomboid family intramembrane serine protease [Winogradskyella immobilis]